jgi:chromosomal replication initiation ATPase DnaA
VVRLVAFATQVPVDLIHGPERGVVEVSRARQLSMYLLHTRLSLSFVEIARYFRRDRTTVAKACATIEDLREIPERDDFVGDLEAMLELALSMAAAPVWPARLLAAAE